MNLYSRLKQIGLRELLKEIEVELINDALANTKNFSQAAKLLQLPRPTLVYKRQTHGMPVQPVYEEKLIRSKYGGNE